MIDTKNAKWELSEHEQYAIKWFEANGYNGRIEKQYLSKTKFKVSKYGVTDYFELPAQDITDIATYMRSCDNTFLLLSKLHGHI